MNKFIQVNDKRVDSLGDFVIPWEWWSRPYEYAFACDYLNENDVILDAGCGLPHPFKFYAASKVKKCYAIDNDPDILALKEFENELLEFRVMNFSDLSDTFGKGFFDKIFCISVLEHDRFNLENNLAQFKEVLKDDGLMVITVDVPFIEPWEIEKVVDKLELEFVGGKNFDKPSDVLTGSVLDLNVITLLLKKKGQIKPKETKPLKPKERK